MVGRGWAWVLGVGACGQDGEARPDRGAAPVELPEVSPVEEVELRAPRVELPSFAPLVAAVEPAVVAISVEVTPAPADVPPPLRPFLGGRGVARGEGSGFVVTEDGLVLTNDHLVHDATRILARFSDGREVEARVVGLDPPTDVALLKLVGDGGWSHVDLGTSADLSVGDWVIAVGNPFGLGSTVTAGIVSGAGRSIGHAAQDEFLQTDAAINVGNSGGPLFDTSGRVVGMTTAVVRGANTVGFAIPADVIREVLEPLRSEGAVARGYVGVRVQPMDRPLREALGVPEGSGALVALVEPDSPAARAGLEAGDVILEVGGTPVADDLGLVREVGRHRPGERVAVRWLRDRRERRGELSLAARPDAGATAAAPEPTGSARSHRLGATLAPLPPASSYALGVSRGVLVVSVDPDGPAAAALRRGDVIVEVDGREVAQPGEAAAALRGSRGPVVLRVVREGEARYVAIRGWRQG